MSNKIILKHSTVPGSVPLPDDLAIGEIAMNVADGRLFAKIPSGEIEEFAKSATIKSFSSITGDVGTIEATQPAETFTIKGGSGVLVTAMHATNEIVVALNNADAATLGGHAASYFATADHLHDDRYLKLQVAGGDYYTQAQVDANITTAIDNLINGAGSAYDTLKELEAALLDNDSDIAAINSTIATKLDATAYNAADVLAKLKTVDGATSGLDADLLDGQHGAFYRNATNINAGTLPVARLSGIYDIGVSGNAATATKLAAPITLALTGDATGSVVMDGSADASINVTVGNDSHTHDARYYEKTVADGRFLGINAKAVDADKLDGHDAGEFQLIMPTAQKSGLPVGWYTIAVNYGNRAVARFGVRDTNSGDHQSCVFYASHHFGTHSEITVLHSGRYSGTPIRHLRIKEGGTYDGAMLQVYLDHTSHTVQAFLYGENFQEQGWTIKDWIPDGTNPGGLKNFANLTNTAAQVNLDNIMDGGMATTGQMFIGGKTTQYKVWHAGNDGPGSGLNADLLDGKDSTYFATKAEHDAHLHDDRYVQLTGDQAIAGVKTFSDPVQIGGSLAQGESVTFDGSTSVGLRVSNGSGYISITPMNAKWAHIYTDRDTFIFNKPVASLVNTFRSYDGDLLLQRGANTTSATKLTLGLSQATFVDGVVAPSFSGDGSAVTNVDAVTLGGKSLLTVEGEYAAADTATLASANAHADSAAASALASANSYTDTQVAALIDTAPGTLDTLNELAAALGDDPNFATTITNQIALKLDATAYTAADVLAKLKTVDGAGSGLDADLLDGRSSTYFATKSEHDAHLHDDRYLQLTGGVLGGDLTMTSLGTTKLIINADSGNTNENGNPIIELVQDGGAIGATIGMTGASVANNGMFIQPNATAHTSGKNDLYHLASDGLTFSRFWHEGNDGAGSGLDADLFDGEDSSAFVKVVDGLSAHLPVTIAAASEIATNDNGSSASYPHLSGFRDGSGQVSYAVAQQKAAEHGARLPTIEELEAGITAGTGHSYDASVTWSCTPAGDGFVWGVVGNASKPRVKLNIATDTAVTGYVANKVSAPDSLYLEKIKRVDGTGSGLDADTVDGKELATIESEYAAADAATLTSANSYADSAAAGALASANSYTDTQVAALVDASPGTLDTLNELAAALGDDPNFATTISNQIGLKLDATAYTAADVRNKLKTVDGSGSGIDADLLDGKHASAFSLTSHTHSSSPGPFTIDSFVEISAPASLVAGNDVSIVTNQGTNWIDLRAVDTKGFLVRQSSNSGSTWNDVLTAYVDDTFQFKGNQVWHAGHQGAGTGMDADTLDGKHASDLATADHLHDERYVNKTGDNMTGPLGIDSGTDVGFQMAYDPATKSLNFNFVGA